VGTSLSVWSASAFEMQRRVVTSVQNTCGDPGHNTAPGGAGLPGGRMNWRERPELSSVQGTPGRAPRMDGDTLLNMYLVIGGNLHWCVPIWRQGPAFYVTPKLLEYRLHVLVDSPTPVHQHFIYHSYCLHLRLSDTVTGPSAIPTRGPFHFRILSLFFVDPSVFKL
jgi:hypothetical protein